MNKARFELPSTIVGCSIVTALLSVRHGGVLLVLCALILVPWTIQSLWVAARNPLRRRLVLIKVGVWVVGVLFALGLHVRMYEKARTDGNQW
jgi:hypothetical protein